MKLTREKLEDCPECGGAGMEVNILAGPTNGLTRTCPSCTGTGMCSATPNPANNFGNCSACAKENALCGPPGHCDFVPKPALLLGEVEEAVKEIEGELLVGLKVGLLDEGGDMPVPIAHVRTILRALAEKAGGVFMDETEAKAIIALVKRLAEEDTGSAPALTEAQAGAVLEALLTLQAAEEPLELYHAYGWKDRNNVIRRVKLAGDKLRAAFKQEG